MLKETLTERQESFDSSVSPSSSAPSEGRQELVCYHGYGDAFCHAEIFLCITVTAYTTYSNAKSVVPIFNTSFMCSYVALSSSI